MKSEQMKRVGMLANARFDGETDPENVQDPAPDNPEAKPSVNELLEDMGLDVGKIPEEGLSPSVSEQPGDGEWELVKEKPAKCAGLRRFIRPALLLLAVVVAYKLFFAKRR